MTGKIFHIAEGKIYKRFQGLIKTAEILNLEMLNSRHSFIEKILSFNYCTKICIRSPGWLLPAVYVIPQITFMVALKQKNIRSGMNFKEQFQNFCILDPAIDIVAKKDIGIVIS